MQRCRVTQGDVKEQFVASLQHSDFTVINMSSLTAVFAPRFMLPCDANLSERRDIPNAGIHVPNIPPSNF